MVCAEYAECGARADDDVACDMCAERGVGCTAGVFCATYGGLPMMRMNMIKRGVRDKQSARNVRNTRSVWNAQSARNAQNVAACL